MRALLYLEKEFGRLCCRADSILPHIRAFPLIVECDDAESASQESDFYYAQFQSQSNGTLWFGRELSLLSWKSWFSLDFSLVNNITRCNLSAWRVAAIAWKKSSLSSAAHTQSGFVRGPSASRSCNLRCSLWVISIVKKEWERKAGGGGREREREPSSKAISDKLTFSRCS